MEQEINKIATEIKNHIGEFDIYNTSSLILCVMVYKGIISIEEAIHICHIE